MSLDNKLMEKAFYWGPLFVGVISLVIGAVMVRGSTDYEFGDRYAQFQQKQTEPLTLSLRETSARKQSQDKVAQKEKSGPELNSKDLPQSKKQKTQKIPQAAKVTVAKETSDKETVSKETVAKEIIAPSLAVKLTAENNEKENIPFNKGELSALKKTDNQNKPDVNKTSEGSPLGKKPGQEILLTKKTPLNKDELPSAKIDPTAKKTEDDVAVSLINKPDGKPVLLPIKKPEDYILPSTLVTEDSLLAGKAGGVASSGFLRLDQGFEKLQISQHSVSIAQMGLISISVVNKLVDRSVIFSAHREAKFYGLLGQHGKSGLQLALKRQDRVLIKHRSVQSGLSGSSVMKGVLLTHEPLRKIIRQDLTAASVKFGSAPRFALTGIDSSLNGALIMKQRSQFASLGRGFGKGVMTDSYAGMGVVLKSIPKQNEIEDGDIQKKSGVDLAALDHDSKKLNCAENFYSSLQALQLLKISSLSSAIKPISRIDKSLPGKWTFRPRGSAAKRVCKRYKRYYSGRKKCVKWGQKIQPIAVTDGPDQKLFFKLAGQLIAGRGRHPVVKPRSPGHWVINRIARDLKSYALQKPHPAICTGALGMINYFEGNLRKVKSHIEEIDGTALKSDDYLKYWQGELVQTLQDSANGAGVTGKNGAELSIEEQLDQIANQRHLTFFTEDFDISSADLSLALSQVASKIFGAEAGLEISDSEDVLFALRYSKKQLLKNRKRLPAKLYMVLYKFYSTVEASFYLRKANQRYTPLKEQLFGSLTDIRSAHQTHCLCEN